MYSVQVQENQSVLHEVLRDATRRFQEAGITNAAGEARLLAAHYLGVPATEIFLHLREPVPVGLLIAIERREGREPLQHIVGTAPFGPLEILVGPGVFVPRPETEVLAHWAVEKLNSGIVRPTVLDLCTGSGALAAYIAYEVRHAQVIGVEYAQRAFEWADKNRLNLHAQHGIHYNIVRGDVIDPMLLAELTGKVDLIVCNPPYVPRDDSLDPEVYADPDDAVFAGATGMDIINKLGPQVSRLLRPGGAVGIEHDDATSVQVQEVIKTEPELYDVQPLMDLTGRNRFVTASKR
ncbi:peptide chain release factor N(5)-glutamine methyltransferase [Corynebacterium propinquum]|uniref:Release factor glutamine methyltransferase n=1 Tax=Corynebacterium propinquum TaxID=43769 RepID=A0AAP4BSJ1_9CORY|nr:peptide chain release factor N(5)-glutamine methyltransferase [Corynebacterium propinquum]MCG7231674.1 peptide chain release factor N(5)-glutamine methyltransferase [Corynebacterium propinquum]MCT1817479.1 peptide chain release factor N(5)-glutamine methyltransferase [Corynebacterium propinquum]MDK4233899.1 peptide chain release factor N(5)-glutamine methyltransferase [Corynebacterium propinquum]MDK4238806.1 peptide chain release factor N(5)-glutamine methyltransferase [Corynebacterium propi